MNTRTATRSLLGLSLLFVGACDDAAEQRKPGPTPAADTAGKPAPVPEATKTTPAPPTIVPPTVAAPTVDTSGIVRNYSACYSACFSERASATNRETCKLNCDSVAETALEALKGAPPKDAFMKTLGSFNGCVNACYDDKSLNETNRATCVLTCQDNAELAASAK